MGHNTLRRLERNSFYEDGYYVRHIGKTLENVTILMTSAVILRKI